MGTRLSVLKLFIFLLIVVGCSPSNPPDHDPGVKFTTEMQELKEYFQIPGLAISIEKDGQNIYSNYLGLSDIEKKTKLDSTVLFPIASITKIFTGVLIMKLVEDKKLSLEDPITNYLPKSKLDDSILIKHILSHTSQGDIGNKFYYSSRFGILTSVIEQVSGKPFAEFMNEEIIVPLNLKNTFLLKDSNQIIRENKKIASPYILDNGVEYGFIDYGFSASAGIVSNLEDLATFNSALDNNKLITKQSKDIMYTSYKTDLPYAYGIFNQQFKNLSLVWAYGQYDCYSSLLLKIPSKNITLTLLANNNLLSDPARLIYGDATSSLFVMSFLKNYIFDLHEMDLFEKGDSIFNNNIQDPKFLRKKVLAQALAESYMSRFDPEKMKTSTHLLKSVFAEYPDYLEYANLNLLHNLSFLKDVAFYMDLGEFNEFDTHIENIGKKLLTGNPDNPYTHSYMGTYFARKGNTKKAKYLFETIVNAKNFSENWYTREARDWLNELK